MKRERESDDESDDQGGISKSRTSTEEYGMYNPGYSFVRPPVVQTKPSTKRTRAGDGNSTANKVPVKYEPEPERFRELSIKAEHDAGLCGLESGVGPSRRNNLTDVQTPRHNNTTTSMPLPSMADEIIFATSPLLCLYKTCKDCDFACI